MSELDRYLVEVFADCIRGEADLHDYQIEAIEWLIENAFSGLFIDVGMGKTIIILTLLDHLFTHGYNGRVLIIAPIRVVRRVWAFEHRLWRHTAYMAPEILRVDDDDPRLKAYAQEAYRRARDQGHDEKLARQISGRLSTNFKWQMFRQLCASPRRIHVTNKEAVDGLVKAYGSKWPYRVVIFDESSALGDHNTIIFKAMQKIRPKLIRFHELTASPASQTYMKFFSQTYLLDLGERFGKSITRYRENYFTYNPYARTWKIRDGAAEQIEEKIADICLVMRTEKNHVIVPRYVRLPREVMRQYRDFERDAVLSLPDDKVIDAVNGAALSNKLLQFASGAVYGNDVVLDSVTGDPIKLQRVYYEMHNEKIEDLRSLAEETLDQPIMVAYWYRSSLERLRKAFPHAGVMDREGKIEHDWNRGKFKLMFVHPRGVAHGMNLQAGGHHIALFDVFWPLELFTQLIGRLDRQGQTSTVVVHLISAVGTHDDVVTANLEHLRSAEESMFRRLQALRRKYQQERMSDDHDDGTARPAHTVRAAVARHQI